MVTGLLKPWAVWLLNKRAAVPAVGTGKPQRWLPGTRGSRLVSVTLCPPSPFFFFLFFAVPGVAAKLLHPLPPAQAPGGLSVRPVPCSLLHGSAVPQVSVSSSPQGLGHAPRAQTWDVLPPKTAPLNPPQLLSPLRHFSSCRKCPESPGGDGCSALSLAAPKEQRWWPFLGRCPLFSSLPLPPPLPPKPPVLFHCVAKQDFHCILVSRPALPFVIHRAPRGAWRGTSPHAGSPGSPGTRGPIQALGPEWHTQKPRPRAAAARFASHVCLTST